MGRGRLQPGQVGDVGVGLLRRDGGRWRVVTGARRNGDRYRARARFCDWDGSVRELSRMAPRRGDAEAALAVAIDGVLRSSSEPTMGRQTSFAEAGEMWVRELKRADSGKAATTVRQYERTWRRYVLAAPNGIRNFTVEQVNDPQRLRRFLQGVADAHGTASAKLARAVVSGVLNFAVENGVLQSNALRQIGPVKGDGRPRKPLRDRRRALTPEEESLLLEVANARAEAAVDSRTARTRERTRDLLVYLLGTGVRIGEALLLRWDDVDLARSRVQVRGTKTASSHRALNLGANASEMLSSLAQREGTQGYVFSSPGLADPQKPWLMRTAQRHIRAVLDEAGLDWAISHSARRTVATKLDEAGFPTRRIADQLGHKDVRTTQSAYLGRDPQGDKADLAAAL